MVDSLINSLGGTCAVAEKFGLKPPVVSNWRKRGIPGRRWSDIIKLAADLKVPGVTLEALVAMHANSGSRA